MKIKYFPILTIAILFSASICAQNYEWRNFSPENDNYFDFVSKHRSNMEKLRSQNTTQSKKEIKQFERWASFWKDRITPNGDFVSPMHTYGEWVKENQKNAQQRETRSVHNNTWSLLGPTTPPQSTIAAYPGMGRVNTLAFQTDNTNILYVGTPAGGIWKSTNGGSSWAAKSDNLPNIGISHIVISPSDSNVLYAATGDWDGGHNFSVGVVKSTDAGESWSLTGLTFGLTEYNTISKLLIDPNNANTIFATTRNAIKRSTDGGATWSDVHTVNGTRFNDIEYKTNSNSVIYATSRVGRFYRSTDNGENWQEVSRPSSSRLDMAQTPNDPNLILTIDSAGRVRSSVDQGTSWTLVNSISGFGSQGGYDLTLNISPIDKNLIIAGGVDGFRSKDGGTTWEKYLDGYWSNGNPYFYVHSDHHDMVFLPNSNEMYSLNDGGVFKGDASTDVVWTDLSSGLAITQYYNVSGTPQDAGKLILGAQDNDIAVYDGSNGFKGENPVSDGVDGLWNYSDFNIAWSCSQAGGLRRTLDGFQTPAQPLNTPGGAPFVWELEIHPTDPNTIFGGFGDIYKSTNRGTNWTNLDSGLGRIEFISIAPSDANVIYGSGTNGNVKKTVNGGDSWTTITLPQSGFVKTIEVHPTNPSEVYIAYSGYVSGRVYKSTDGGANWTNITGSLPNIPANKIIYRTGTTDGELFLATDLGVYHWKNSVNDWVKLGTGLPNVIATDIEIHYASNKLRTSTYGRGVWEISIDEALSINEVKLGDDAVNMYPNPTNNKQFTIKLNNLNGDTRILIYNIIGSVVKNITTKKTEEFIDLSNYASGIYLVKVNNDQREITKKLMVR